MLDENVIPVDMVVTISGLRDRDSIMENWLQDKGSFYRSLVPLADGESPPSDPVFGLTPPPGYRYETDAEFRAKWVSRP